MKHTPGPWRAEKPDGFYWLVGPLGEYTVAAVYPQTDGSGNDRYDAEANARLIAAAPDLLAALEDIRRIIASRGRTNKDVYVSVPGEYILLMDNVAKNAIAKAEGES